MPNPDLYELPNGDVIFKQRRFLRRHQYRLAKEGVYVVENWVTGSTKYKVAFENIQKDYSEITVSSKGYFWFSLILAGFSAATGLMLLFRQKVEAGAPLTWGILAVITGILFLMSRQHFLVFRVPHGVESLILFKDKPSRELLGSFLSAVQKRKNEYLRQTYLREDGLCIHNALKPDFRAVHQFCVLLVKGSCAMCRVRL